MELHVFSGICFWQKLALKKNLKVSWLKQVAIGNRAIGIFNTGQIVSFVLLWVRSTFQQILMASWSCTCINNIYRKFFFSRTILFFSIFWFFTFTSRLQRIKMLQTTENHWKGSGTLSKTKVPTKKAYLWYVGFIAHISFLWNLTNVPSLQKCLVLDALSL